MAIDFPATPSSPSLLLTTNIHEVIRVIDIYWVMAMAEVDEARIARRGDANLAHAPTLNIRACQLRAHTMIHTHTHQRRICRVREISMTASARRERRKPRVLPGTRLSPFIFSMTAGTAVDLTDAFIYDFEKTGAYATIVLHRATRCTII